MGERWRLLFVGNFFHLSFWLGHFMLDIFFFIYLTSLGSCLQKRVFFLFSSSSPWYLVSLFFLALSFVMDLGRIGVSAGGVDIFSVLAYIAFEGLDGQQLMVWYRMRSHSIRHFGGGMEPCLMYWIQKRLSSVAHIEAEGME